MLRKVAFAALGAGLIALALSCESLSPPPKIAASDGALFPACLIEVAETSAAELQALRAEGYRSVALAVEDGPLSHPAIGAREAIAQAAARIEGAGLGLIYWIEVGRCPALADAHPLWMASIQGPHPEWRRYFKDLRQPETGEVVKTWPWVPILYQESFEAQRQRLAQLLAGLPPARAILLNDLQAAPSACGCGHILCRWTTDYGPVVTATRIADDAAARFVAAARELAPRSEVIPVWTTECEEHDMADGGRCAGVHCFDGRCWSELAKQLTPLAAASERLGLLLPYKTFERDEAAYGPTAGWVGKAIASMTVVPPKRGGQAVPAQRLIAVLQGWNVSPEELSAQIEAARRAGAGGWLVARKEIPQSWEPRIVRIK